jgi:hypothetical protein
MGFISHRFCAILVTVLLSWWCGMYLGYFDDQFVVIFVLNKCPGFLCVRVGWLKWNNRLVFLSGLFSIMQVDTTSVFAGFMSMLANRQHVHTFLLLLLIVYNYELPNHVICCTICMMSMLPLVRYLIKFHIFLEFLCCT